MKARADVRTAEGSVLRLLNAATLLVAASNGEASRSFRAAVVNFMVNINLDCEVKISSCILDLLLVAYSLSRELELELKSLLTRVLPKQF